MATRPRIFNNPDFFDSAAGMLSPGRYKYYEDESIPDFLKEDDQQRTPSAYQCKLVVATSWSQGTIGGITPIGPTYIVFDYTDHRHQETDFHFNKEVKFYYEDEGGQHWRLTMNKDIDGHFIDAVATGTALPYLRGVYRLPNMPEGTIDDLIDYGTSIGPYPTGSE